MLGAASIPHLLARVANTPLMLLPEKAEAIWSVLEAKMLGRLESLTEHAAADPNLYRRRSPLSIRDGVAILDVHGTLVHRASGLDAMSGLTSYQELKAELAQAVADPDVHSILLNVDSPGGEVAGAFDFADAVHAASRAKRVWGLAEDQACSAAYLALAACEKVFATQTAQLGSIGVYLKHRDLSEMNRREGVVETEITAGEFKADGSSSKPLSDAARARLQARVDETRELFVHSVARFRAIDPARIRAQEAGIYAPAAAIREGLADEVATLETLIDQLRVHPGSERSIMTAADATLPQAAAPEAPKKIEGGTAVMIDMTEDAAPEALAARLRDHFPQAVAVICGEERARVQKIKAAALPGQEALAEKLAADPAMTEGQAALAYLEAHRNKAAARRAALDADEVDLEAILPSASAPDQASATGAAAVEGASALSAENLRAVWDGSSKLSAEFTSFESFATYAKNHPEVLRDA